MICPEPVLANDRFYIQMAQKDRIRIQNGLCFAPCAHGGGALWHQLSGEGSLPSRLLLLSSMQPAPWPGYAWKRLSIRFSVCLSRACRGKYSVLSIKVFQQVGPFSARKLCCQPRQRGHTIWSPMWRGSRHRTA
jgi:hypothetical protein